jgi:DNA polymerase alpha subunit A
MAGSRADRNEFLLLHEFHNKKYIVPDKTQRSFRPAVDLQQDDDGKTPLHTKTNIALIYNYFWGL